MVMDGRAAQAIPAGSGGDGAPGADGAEPPARPLRRESFRIEALPPSLNRIIRERSIRLSEPAKWVALVRAASRRIAPFWHPVRITFTFGGRMDADNGPKLPLDAIVRAGLIRDDRYPFLSELVLRSRPSRRPYTLVEIEEVA
jgi:hypothetical protein